MSKWDRRPGRVAAITPPVLPGPKKRPGKKLPPQAARMLKEEAAELFAEKNQGPLADVLVQVMEDLAPELDGLAGGQFAKDARIAAEMAYRLDNGIQLPGVLEVLDFFGFFLASLAVIGVFRSIEKKAGAKDRKIKKLRKMLDEKGPKMAKSRRDSIKRRLKKLAK